MQDAGTWPTHREWSLTESSANMQYSSVPRLCLQTPCTGSQRTCNSFALTPLWALGTSVFVAHGSTRGHAAGSGGAACSGTRLQYTHRANTTHPPQHSTAHGSAYKRRHPIRSQVTTTRHLLTGFTAAVYVSLQKRSATPLDYAVCAVYT